MKFVEVKETEVEDASFEINIFFKSKKSYMNLSYTCPECCGHGCNTHVHNNDECSRGTVNKTVTTANFEKVFTQEQRNIIYTALQKLLPGVTEV